jgi:hypothetical protein
VVAKAWHWPTEKGGIIHLDVVSKKLTWVTRDPLAQSGPFCSHDGASVFYNRFRPLRPGEEKYDTPGHGIMPDGLWAHDRTSGKTRKISDSRSHDDFDNPASPRAKIYALVASEKKYLAARRVTLPGWQIVTFPKDDRIVDKGRWAHDGSYLVLSVRPKPESLFVGPTAYLFYTPEGQLIREVPWAALQPGSARWTKPMPDGLYAVGKDGRMRRVNPWSGVIEELSFQVTLTKGLFTFDVAPNGDISYSLGNTGIRIVSPSGEEVPIPIPGSSHPVFSPNGEYLAFLGAAAKANTKLVIVERQGGKT